MKIYWTKLTAICIMKSAERSAYSKALIFIILLWPDTIVSGFFFCLFCPYPHFVQKWGHPRLSYIICTYIEKNLKK